MRGGQPAPSPEQLYWVGLRLWEELRWLFGTAGSEHVPLTTSVSPAGKSVPKIRGTGAAMSFLFNTAANAGYECLSFGPWIPTVLANTVCVCCISN